MSTIPIQAGADPTKIAEEDEIETMANMIRADRFSGLTGFLEWDEVHGAVLPVKKELPRRSDRARFAAAHFNLRHVRSQRFNRN
jgi:hypothetical protein